MENAIKVENVTSHTILKCKFLTLSVPAFSVVRQARSLCVRVCVCVCVWGGGGGLRGPDAKTQGKVYSLRFDAVEIYLWVAFSLN